VVNVDDTSTSTNERRNERRETVVVGVALLGFSLLVGWQAWQIASRTGMEWKGPAAFPVVVAAGLLITSAVYLWRAIGAPAAQLLEHIAGERAASQMRVVAWVLALLVIYALLLAFVGYPVATTAMFAVCARLLGARRWLLNLLIGAVLSASIFVLFTEVLHVRLPLGLWLEGLL
jgi:putative tricarboxylic transport membrane protein